MVAGQTGGLEVVGSALGNVRFVPIADSCTAAMLSLFDHPVGAAKQQKRYSKAGVP
jgi:hypothetical protein